MRNATALVGVLSDRCTDLRRTLSRRLLQPGALIYLVVAETYVEEGLSGSPTPSLLVGLYN